MTSEHSARPGLGGNATAGLTSAPNDALSADVIAILDTVDVPIIVVGRDCSLVRFNRAAGDVLGIVVSDIGRRSRTITALKDVSDLETLCTQVMADEATIRRDVRSADRQFLMRIAPYSRAAGEIAGAVVTFTNVTAFRASLEQAVYEREYTKTILNTVRSPLVILDAQLRVQSANRAFYTLFDVSRENTQGVPLRSLGDDHWKASALWTSLTDVVSDQRDFERLEIERTFPRLGLRTILLDACPIPRQGNATILLAFQDITDRRESEQELRASQAQLASEADALIRLTDASSRLWQMPDLHAGLDEMLSAAIALLRADMGNIQLVSSIGGALQIAAHCGFHQDFLDFFREVTTEDDSACGRALRTGERTIVEDVEIDPPFAPLRAIARAAGFRAVQSTPLIGRSGKPLGMLSTHWRSPHRPTEQDLRRLDLYARLASDFIERVASDQSLRASEERLRETDRRKDEFLAMLAHELRNPLAPIRTGLELVRLAGDSPQSVARVRQILERQVGHMVRLIDDLLDVSRITTGKIQLQRKPTPLLDLVSAAVEANRPAIDAAGLELTVTMPEIACLLDVDPTRFVQVLSNLLHNATKFTPAGGHVHLSASLCSSKADDGRPELELRVADDGVGISPDTLPRVFELFAQGEASGDLQAASGLGIGLALARRLIDMHGGRIDARSDGSGRGSVFTIHLPVAPATSVREEDRAEGTAPHHVARRVVIIDDNADAAAMLAMLIGDLGGEVHVAHDGAAGAELVQRIRPDVVLLDIGMPAMDGYETCRRIRSESSVRDLFIVALTGWGQEQDKQRAHDAGFDAHLTKPADPASLARLLADPPKQLPSTRTS